MSMANKEKNRRGFWIKEIQSAPSCEVRRITWNERSTSYNLRQALIVTKRCQLLIVNCCLLLVVIGRQLLS